MATLRYCVEMLTWEQCDSLPPSLQPPGELDDSYVCMLFNDEVHTYEQVQVTVLQIKNLFISVRFKIYLNSRQVDLLPVNTDVYPRVLTLITHSVDMLINWESSCIGT